jgi:hypothetical protein
VSLKELRQLVRSWQFGMKLPEWELIIWWMNKAKLKEYPDANGLCEWDDQHKCARIWICREAQSIPHAVVHELLHLRLEGNRPFELRNETSEWEFALNTLATVITGIKL